MLETELQDSILRITLNRPEKRNALNFEMCRQMAAAFDQAGSDPETRVVVLTANGNTFSSGMDLTEAGTIDEDSLANIHNALFNIGERFTKPIIAAVNGDALAGGLGLVANAHIVIAAPRIAFGQTEIKIGLWPFLIFRSVARAIGERRAMEWAFTGRSVDVEEAKSAGLVHRICKNPYESAFELARSLAKSSSTAIRSGLGFTHESRGRTWEEAGRIGHGFRRDVMASREFTEGLQAFREKRGQVANKSDLPPLDVN